MKNVGVGLKGTPVGSLQITQFLWFVYVAVGGKKFIDEEVPNLFATLPGIESFVLGITNTAELLVRGRRFSAVRMAHELNDPFAVINLLAQHCAQISAFGTENVLPHGLVTEK